MKISGTTFIHNGVEHDYCFEECVRSLLGVCDQVIVVEAASTDNTRAVLESIGDPRLEIVSAEWNPKPLMRAGEVDWTKDLAEIARAKAIHPMNLYVQADEVVHEDDYSLIRSMAESGDAISLHRLNFWTSAFKLAPAGHVCGVDICRLAPRDRKVVWGSEHLEDQGVQCSGIRLFHYGFIRKGSGFRKKSEIMGQNFMGTIDPIIYEYETKGPEALKTCFQENALQPYEGTHPTVAHGWLRERGFLIPKD